MSQETRIINRAIASKRRKRVLSGDPTANVTTVPVIGSRPRPTFYFSTTEGNEKRSNTIFYIVIVVILLSAIVLIIYFRKSVLRFFTGKKNTKEKGTQEKDPLKVDKAKPNGTPAKKSSKSKSTDEKKDKTKLKAPRVVESKLSGISSLGPAPSDKLSVNSYLSNANPSSMF